MYFERETQSPNYEDQDEDEGYKHKIQVLEYKTLTMSEVEGYKNLKLTRNCTMYLRTKNLSPSNMMISGN